MNFNDIFKSNFLEQASSFSILDVAIAMAVSFVLGLFIFFVYKKTFSGVMYSSSFAVSLMALSLITSLVILAVTSNIILSLGMVGALSIVRFRTAIKEPMDIAFLFWAIAAGIVTGAGLIPLAVFGSLFIGIILLIFVNKKSYETPYIAVINCTNQIAEEEAMKVIKAKTKKQLVKSKSVSKNGIELTIEVRLMDFSTSIVNTLSEIEGVTSAVLISYNGDFMN